MVQKSENSCAGGNRLVDGPQQNMAIVIGLALASTWATLPNASSAPDTPSVADSVKPSQGGQPDLTAVPVST